MFFLVFQFVLTGVVACSTTKRPNNTRIVGGEEIDIKEAPYQVSLIRMNRHVCGGSVIENDIIITAAHCLYDSEPSDWKVRSGSSFSKEGGEINQVSGIFIHPDYSNQGDYDVGLIRLSKPLVFSDIVKLIKLADVNDEIPDEGECAVTGWGYLKGNGEVSETLQKVKVPKISQDECKFAYKELDRPITPRMICAGYPEGGKDACQGDSGGPMVYNDKLYGIVSWGIGCAQPGYPGVYANIAVLRKWIDENTAKLRTKRNLKKII